MKKLDILMEKRVLGVLLGLILTFSIVAKGAHDLWSSTLNYALILSLATGAILVWQWKRPKMTWVVPLMGPLFVLLGALAVSAWFAPNRFDSRWEWFDWAAAGLVFFLSAQAFSDEGGRRILAIFCSLWGWILGAVSAGMVASRGFPFEVQGTLVNANAMSGFLLLFIPVLAEKVRSLKKGKDQWAWFWWGGLLGSLVALVLALSLMAWALLFVFTPIVFWEDFRKKKTVPMVWAAALLGVAGIALYWSPVFFGEGREPFARLIWWNAALHMWLSHPIVGVGLDNFSTAFLAFKTGPGLNTLFPHSWLLGLLGQCGVAGAGAFIWLVISALKTAVSERESGKKPFIFGTALFLIYGLVNLSLEYAGPLMVFFSVLAVLSSTKKSPGVSFPRWAALAAVGLVVLVGPWIFSPWVGQRLVGAAEIALSEKNPNKAFEFFSDAIEVDPLNWKAFEGRGRSLATRYLETRSELDLSNAIVSFQTAHNLNPYNAGVLIRLSVLLKEAGRMKEAEEAAAAAAKINPSAPAAL